MRLILLLFMSGSMFLTSTAMAKNQAQIACKCNSCVVDGKIEGKYFAGTATHTLDGRVRGSAYPRTLLAKQAVKGLMMAIPSSTPTKRQIVKACSKLGFKCKVIVFKCIIPKGPKLHKGKGPSEPKMGPAEPVEQAIIKTSDRITKPPKDDEKECV